MPVPTEAHARPALHWLEGALLIVAGTFCVGLFLAVHGVVAIYGALLMYVAAAFECVFSP